ncbi:hypothetical protein L484_023449 [Morus notabilis]|uniref:Uncharacterized protein n=1 Tax=Morus notabilis TaxID=981085 RepID=W9RLG1_9ROSA|nr:hypothetical protein L484_023449 [Morus notabilis]
MTYAISVIFNQKPKLLNKKRLWITDMPLDNTWRSFMRSNVEVNLFRVAYENKSCSEGVFGRIRDDEVALPAQNLPMRLRSSATGSSWNKVVNTTWHLLDVETEIR